MTVFLKQSNLLLKKPTEPNQKVDFLAMVSISDN